KSLTARHALYRTLGIAIEPFCDRSIRSVDAYTQPAECPAIVSDRDEKAGRQTVRGGDFAPDQRNLATETHGAHAQAIGFVHDRSLKLGKLRVGIDVVER